MEHILSLIVFFPLIAMFFGFIVNKDSVKTFGILVALVEFVFSIILWIGFDTSNAGFQFVEYAPLISKFGVSYYLGVD